MIAELLRPPGTFEVPPGSRDVPVTPPLVYVPATWEYRHIVRRPPAEPVLDEEQLNALGADGWELAGVYGSSDEVHYYFKRLAG